MIVIQENYKDIRLDIYNYQKNYKEMLYIGI